MKNISAEILKKIMNIVLQCEVETVSSPLCYQETVPQLFKERYLKDDSIKTN